MNYKLKIAEIATQVRTIIENLPRDKLPSHWSKFPRGTCAETSLILGAFLVDNGYKDFLCFNASREGNKSRRPTHAWLQNDRLIVDITSDQFVDAPRGIIVAEESPWHKSFRIDKRDLGDFRRYQLYLPDLPNTYNLIKQEIESKKDC